MTYLWHLSGIHGAGTYMAMQCEVKVAVCCFKVISVVMWHLYMDYSSSTMGHICVMWQSLKCFDQFKTS